MIFMYFIGSYGFIYFKCYLKEMVVYQFDCLRVDIENCSVEQIVNMYDNIICYSDYVMLQFFVKFDLL